MKLIILALCVLFAYVTADMYMQAPHGCNDRLNEANTNRDNGNRLFDSQNNAKGGYCWGPSLTYYEGSLLTVEWTNQHGCGTNGKLHCNIIIQYMCSKKDADPTLLVRDGTSTDTIDNNAQGATTRDNNGELKFGMNENFAYYTACATRQRNMGLYISDREDEGGLDQGRATAIFTRQNNNGDRHGYECAEERDYYPYWHPTPWRDLAVLADNSKFCDFYRKESQNVKAKNYCSDKDGNPVLENNQVACHQKDPTYIWQKTNSWGIPAPACIQAHWSRDNHLGNGPTGFANSFNVSIPKKSWESCINKDANCNCVLRIRYNISTGDTGPNSNNIDKGFIDWTSNAGASPIYQDPILNQTGLPMQLAMNTNQFGRTFQDRSYMFHIRTRPHGVATTEKIYNLGVRGKRGNIVETYPATEYDFTPEHLYVTVGNYIHFQWTGCDTNPAGNAGEGTDGTDRSNIVQIQNLDASHPATDKWLSSHTPMFESKWLRQHMAMLDQTGCLTYAQLLAQNNNNANDAKQDPANCMKLNAAPTGFFDGGLIKMNKTGTFYYMSSRNNNFSNRGQKAVLTVSPLLPPWAVGVVVTGAILFLGSAGVAGAMLYAKSHPHSSIANVFTKI